MVDGDEILPLEDDWEHSVLMVTLRYDATPPGSYHVVVVVVPPCLIDEVLIDDDSLDYL